MILIYLLAVTPTTVVVNLLTVMGLIVGLAVFVTVLQWTIDKKVAKYKQELRLEKKEEEKK